MAYIVIGQEKPHNVDLAPEYEYRANNMLKAHEINLKHVPWPEIHLGVSAD